MPSLDVQAAVDCTEMARDSVGARSSSLSVCCLTNERPAMVARSLSIVRDVAHEIVVAVDSRVDPAELGVLVDVADVVLRFEYLAPAERALPWLIGACRSADVLVLDGDEVPSAALVDEIPKLAADRQIVQSRIARRWCFPDERTWLAERPWWPDFRVRHAKRLPSLDVDVCLHGGIRPSLPARFVDAPLYHLPCATVPFADRRRRAREHNMARPGLAARGGGPMNDALLAPEHFATRRPAPVPPDDLATLRAVLGAATPAVGIAPSLPIVSAREIAEHLPKDPLAAQGYHAGLRVVEHDLRTDPGNDTMIVVEVQNHGLTTLSCADAPGVQLRVGACVLDRRPSALPPVWSSTPLLDDVPPHESRLVEVLVRVPADEGVYTVELRLVNERAAAFDCSARLQLAVTTRWGRYTV